jgi:hypothetical protein
MGNARKAPPVEMGDFNEWYDAYTRSFINGDPSLEDAVLLKFEHTKRVCGEMEPLCDSIPLDKRRRTLAVIAALLHDIARFEQFRRYRTFSDKRSFDHAEAACAIIAGERLLSGLADDDASDVLCAIRHHNAVKVPIDLNTEATLLCRLLRDADKLDIYRIALDYYINPDPRRRETVQVGIPDGSTVTPEVCERVLRREIIPYEQIRTVADFKMIQLGWVFDLNFSHSFRCVKERGYIENLKRQLPLTRQVLEAFDEVELFLEERSRAQ